MLLPALNSAREKAKTMSCGNNQKQIGTMINLYLSDSDDYYPAWRWPKRVLSYFPKVTSYAKTNTTKFFICPNAAKEVTNLPVVLTYQVTGVSYTVSAGQFFFAAALNDDTKTSLIKSSQVWSPTKKIYLADRGEYAYTNTGTTPSNRQIVNRHRGFGNILLADGHVQALKLPANILPGSETSKDWPQFPHENAYRADVKDVDY